MDCIEENLPNGFEQALPSSSPSASANQYVATDITVPEGMNFNLATLNAYLWVTGGMVVSAEIVVYADDDGVPDSDAIIAAFDEVLPSSQVELNAQFGYNYYDVSFEIPLTVLQGQSNLTTTYWISIYTSTTGTDGAWEMTSDSSVGNQIAYSLNFGSTWQISQNYDAVYNFEGECSFITSVEDYSLVEFEYYPNPAKDNIQLVAKTEIAFVEINDLMGHKVYFETIGASSALIDLSELNKGIYVLKVSSNDLIETYQFVKE